MARDAEASVENKKRVLINLPRVELPFEPAFNSVPSHPFQDLRCRSGQAFCKASSRDSSPLRSHRFLSVSPTPPRFYSSRLSSRRTRTAFWWSGRRRRCSDHPSGLPISVGDPGPPIPPPRSDQELLILPCVRLSSTSYTSQTFHIPLDFFFFCLVSCSIIFWQSRMTKDWLCGEVLKAVFPLLDGKDLALCMLVCRQWRDIARDDYFWKCACAKRWPSICKRSLPALSYYQLFLTFSRTQRPQPLLPPRLSLNDLEFYIDLWSDRELIFSEAISGSVLGRGIRQPPSGVSDILKLYLDGPDYKMVLQVEPSFTITSGSRISVSVLVGRKDTNQMACIIRDSEFNYVDGGAFRALAYAYLNFSPEHPFISGIRAWVSLLFMTNGNENAIDVFGIEIDFCDAASKEHEVLWLLDMLDWK